jgi:hypothetical protein
VNVVEELRLPGLARALEQVEMALVQATRSDDPFLSGVSGHLVSAGGPPHVGGFDG